MKKEELLLEIRKIIKEELKDFVKNDDLHRCI